MSDCTTSSGVAEMLPPLRIHTPASATRLTVTLNGVAFSCEGSPEFVREQYALWLTMIRESRDAGERILGAAVLANAKPQGGAQ